MKKNAFTVYEMVAVVTVLGLITIITVPIIQNSIQKSKESLYNDQVKSIEDAAKKWAMYNLDEIDESSHYVSIQQLKDDGYLQNKDLYSPMDNSVMNGCIEILFDTSIKSYRVVYTESACNN